MSPARKALERLRAVTVTVGGPLILLATVAASVRSAMGALLRGRRPSWPAALGTLVGAFYPGPVRRWMRSWGARRGEGGATEPVHAIEVDAPPEKVWPWLAQLGQDHGGFYSYEWLENQAGCRMRNADRVHPEWQDRQIGEKVMLHPLNGLRVKRFEPGQDIALEGWGSFAVEPLGRDRSRVVCRRAAPQPPVRRLLHGPHRAAALPDGTEDADRDQGARRARGASLGSERWKQGR